MRSGGVTGSNEALNVTHGEFYGLMNFMAPGVTSDGSALLHWHLPPDVLDSTIQLAISAFRES